MTTLEVRGRSIDTAGTLLMGVVNATPDSFSDAGLYPTTESRIDHALRLVDDGADIIDVGGQSAVTGVPEISTDEEIARVVPVIEAVRARSDITLSVETYRADVAAEALAAGAHLVNDISGLIDPALPAACAAVGAGLIIMHNRGRPKQRLTATDLYDDVVEDVVRFLEQRAETAVRGGLPRTALVFDPGIDFAKTPAQTVQVLRAAPRLHGLGRPLLFAISRKDFIGVVTRRAPRDRLAGTLAVLGYLRRAGGGIMRVHDVAAASDLLSVARVLDGESEIPDDALLPRELWREPPVAEGGASG